MRWWKRARPLLAPAKAGQGSWGGPPRSFSGGRMSTGCCQGQGTGSRRRAATPLRPAPCDRRRATAASGACWCGRRVRCRGEAGGPAHKPPHLDCSPTRFLQLLSPFQMACHMRPPVSGPTPPSSSAAPLPHPATPTAPAAAARRRRGSRAAMRGGTRRSPTAQNSAAPSGWTQVSARACKRARARGAHADRAAQPRTLRCCRPHAASCPPPRPTPTPDSALLPLPPSTPPLCFAKAPFLHSDDCVGASCMHARTRCPQHTKPALTPASP